MRQVVQALPQQTQPKPPKSPQRKRPNDVSGGQRTWDDVSGLEREELLVQGGEQSTHKIHKRTQIAGDDHTSHVEVRSQTESRAPSSRDYKLAQTQTKTGERNPNPPHSHHTWTWPNAQIAEAASTARESIAGEPEPCDPLSQVNKHFQLESCAPPKTGFSRPSSRGRHRFVLVFRVLFTVVTSLFWQFQLATRSRVFQLSLFCGEFARANERLRQRTWLVRADATEKINV